MEVLAYLTHLAFLCKVELRATARSSRNPSRYEVHRAPKRYGVPQSVS